MKKITKKYISIIVCAIALIGITTVIGAKQINEKHNLEIVCENTPMEDIAPDIKTA